MGVHYPAGLYQYVCPRRFYLLVLMSGGCSIFDGPGRLVTQRSVAVLNVGDRAIRQVQATEFKAFCHKACKLVALMFLILMTRNSIGNASGKGPRILRNTM